MSKTVNVRFDNGTLNKNSDLPTFNGSSADNTVPAGAVKNPGTAAGNCSNVYCHSIGNLSTAPAAVVTAGGASFRTIAWNTGRSPATAATATRQARLIRPTREASAGSTTANSHAKHVDSSSLSCDYCHITTTVSTVVTVGAMTVIPGGQHLDRTEDVSFKLNGGVTGSYNAGKTCSNTYCHGANPSVAWGGTTDCASCHGAKNNGDLSAGDHGTCDPLCGHDHGNGPDPGRRLHDRLCLRLPVLPSHGPARKRKTEHLQRRNSVRHEDHLRAVHRHDHGA